MVKILIHKILRSCGYELIKYPYGDFYKRMELIRMYKINKIIDIGANIGEYARQMRSIGYKGKIISFEPREESFLKLKENFKSDSNFECYKLGLGEKKMNININVSQNKTSSSILNMLPLHLSVKPWSKYVSKEKIAIEKLDNLIDLLIESGDNVLLKIDTQGYEKHILEGGKQFIKFVKGIQLEMSLEPLYENTPNFFDLYNYITGLGFKICSIERGFYDIRSGRLLQVDGIFYKIN